MFERVPRYWQTVKVPYLQTTIRRICTSEHSSTKNLFSSVECPLQFLFKNASPQQPLHNLRPLRSLRLLPLWDKNTRLYLYIAGLKQGKLCCYRTRISIFAINWTSSHKTTKTTTTLTTKNLSQTPRATSSFISAGVCSQTEAAENAAEDAAGVASLSTALRRSRMTNFCHSLLHLMLRRSYDQKQHCLSKSAQTSISFLNKMWWHRWQPQTLSQLAHYQLQQGPQNMRMCRFYSTKMVSKKQNTLFPFHNFFHQHPPPLHNLCAPCNLRLLPFWKSTHRYHGCDTTVAA